MSANDWPYYIDDPLVDRSAHRLEMPLDEVASAATGRDLHVGSCSCGTMPPTPPWDHHGVFEAYDNHMADVQAEAHRASEKEKA